MFEEISGVVNSKVDVREGQNYLHEDVVELKFHYIQDEKNQHQTIVVIDRESAKDLAFWLVDMFLFGDEKKESEKWGMDHTN